MENIMWEKVLSFLNDITFGWADKAHIEIEYGVTNWETKAVITMTHHDPLVLMRWNYLAIKTYATDVRQDGARVKVTIYDYQTLTSPTSNDYAAADAIYTHSP